MKHFASPSFWKQYDTLPENIRALADEKFALIRENPEHPSLHFKKFGVYWSARVNLRYRALAMKIDGDLLWFWIGLHADYDAML